MGVVRASLGKGAEHDHHLTMHPYIGLKLEREKGKGTEKGGKEEKRGKGDREGTVSKNTNKNK